MLGYAVIIEIGYSLLAVGTTGGLPLHFALLMPRALGFGVLSLALAAIRTRTGGLDISQVRGAARRLPVAAAGVVVAFFALAGFPLLAGFPVHLALWEAVGKQYLWIALGSILGCGGLMIAGLRSLSVLLDSPQDTPWQIGETRLESILLIAGVLALLAAGIFSQLYFPALTGLAQGLEHLVP
jgi:formate hydrogenlyase subunit 3/multisubunit Na+/H+ antiporter MnhD subunit